MWGALFLSSEAPLLDGQIGAPELLLTSLVTWKRFRHPSQLQHLHPCNGVTMLLCMGLNEIITGARLVSRGAVVADTATVIL